MIRREKYYDPEKNRVIFMLEEATPGFWDSVWDIDEDIRSSLLDVRNTFQVQIVKKYLRPQDGFILEGGCGSGNQVAALVNSGYQCIGIDFASRTVETLNKYMPEFDVRLGDVRNLPFENNFFSGYMSLGVIEHFWDGYEPIFREMQRVIKPGGYLFLTFPYMSPIRKMKGRLGLYKLYDGHKPDNFYQFALDHRTVLSALQERGFHLIKKITYNPQQGLWEESPVFNSVFASENRRLLARLFRKVIALLLSPLICHSIALVLRKSSANPDWCADE